LREISPAVALHRSRTSTSRGFAAALELQRPIPGSPVDNPPDATMKTCRDLLRSALTLFSLFRLGEPGSVAAQLAHSLSLGVLSLPHSAHNSRQNERAYVRRFLLSPQRRSGSTRIGMATQTFATEVAGQPMRTHGRGGSYPWG
jgi:hypothetical protein